MKTKNFSIKKHQTQLLTVVGAIVLAVVLWSAGSFIITNSFNVNATESEPGAETEPSSDEEGELGQQPTDNEDSDDELADTDGEEIDEDGDNSDKDDTNDESEEQVTTDGEETSSSDPSQQTTEATDQSENADNADQEIKVMFTPPSSGIIKSYNIDARQETYASQRRGGGDIQQTLGEPIAARYNSHDYYNTYTRTKNQNTEGICWLYAASTSLEYLMEKQYQASPISAKHMDYQMVQPSIAYEESGKRNFGYEHWLAAGGYERQFGSGGNQYSLLAEISSPTALMAEDTFTNIIKSKDSRLSSIGKYEDIWNLSNQDDILVPTTGANRAYSVKQNYNSINDPTAFRYMVSGLRMINNPTYGSSTTKTEVVNQIKAAIQQYGAVWVSTFFDATNCADHHADPSIENFYYTFIDRTTSSTTSVCEGGHAITLIGWDDDWEYEDNGVTKRGAFIVQNSYGDRMPISVGGESYNPLAHFYMSYDSAFTVLYFTSLTDKTTNSVYSMADYKTGLTPADDEYIFQFTSSQREKLTKLSVNQVLFNQDSLDVYLSADGRAESFTKIGTMTALMGMTEYNFETPPTVSGDFAIMLKRRSGIPIDQIERSLNTINVFTTEAPSDDDEDEDDDDEDIIVPDTSVDPEAINYATDSSAPNTGLSTAEESNAGLTSTILLIALPSIIFVVGLAHIKSKKRLSFSKK